MTLDDRLLSELIHKARASHWVAGASVAVSDAQGLAVAAAGAANLAEGTKARVDTLFQIRSVSKIHAATLNAVLLASGAGALDTPVADGLSLGAAARRANPALEAISLRHLLAHSSGVDGDAFFDCGRGDDATQQYMARTEGLDQLFPPGAFASYSNTGIIWAGHLAERQTGMVWDRALAEGVLAPLGLRDSLCLPEEIILRPHAIGHIRSGESFVPVDRWGITRATWPCGGVTATAADVARFGLEHTSARSAASRRLLPDALLAEMGRLQSRNPNLSEPAHQRGLGWVIHSNKPLILGHNGGANDQGAFLRILPEAGVSIAILTNGGHAGLFADDLLSEIYAQIGVTEQEALPELPEGVTLLNRPEEISGQYLRHGMDLRVWTEAEQLIARAEMTETLAETLHHPPALTSALTEVQPEHPTKGAPRAGYRAALGRLGAPVDLAAFRHAPSGQTYIHMQGRATPRVGPIDGERP